MEYPSALRNAKWSDNRAMGYFADVIRGYGRYEAHMVFRRVGEIKYQAEIIRIGNPRIGASGAYAAI